MAQKGRDVRRKKAFAKWARFGALVVITAVVLFPIGGVVYLSIASKVAKGGLFVNFRYILSQTQVLTWLKNSVLVSGATMVFAVGIGASGGYVISRARPVRKYTIHPSTSSISVPQRPTARGSISTSSSYNTRRSGRSTKRILPGPITSTHHTSSSHLPTAQLAPLYRLPSHDITSGHPST